MKKFIALCVFAIGLFIMLPTTSSGSESPPGQVSFVVDHFDIAPAIGLVQEIAFVNQFNQLAPVPEFIEGQEEGGFIIEKSLNTLLDVGYSNKDVTMSKAPTYKMVYNYEFRLSFNYKVIINQSTSINNIQSAGPVTIRILTQV